MAQISEENNAETSKSFRKLVQIQRRGQRTKRNEGCEIK